MFKVEDGTGLSDSNSYCDIAFADTYFTDRNRMEWLELSVEAKNATLIGATDYIDSRFGHVFVGALKVTTQALQFPRDTIEGIPAKLKQAACEYAIRASKAPLAPDPAVDDSGFQVSRRMEKVGPIEDRTDFAFIGPGASRMILRPYPAADMLLRPFLRSTQGRVIRG